VTVPNIPDIVAVGDHITRKGAEKLAALAAVLELHGRRLVCPQVFAVFALLIPFCALFSEQLEPTQKLKQVGSPSAMSEEQITLSDGTVVTYERARQFMDYYCRRYKFGKPDVDFHQVPVKMGNIHWDAVMTVGGRRIGMGSAVSKKAAQTACYLDVTQYLESCDKDLWKTFVEAARSGKDLGMAPSVYFSMSSGLDDEIRDLCHDIRTSSLYKNRPATKVPSNGTDSNLTNAQPRSSNAAHLPRAVLAAKSDRLLRKRQEYLANPDMEKMRNTRMSLPVYTRAVDLIAHVENNEVTICMAATGSGKTTQLPQLILDEWIDKGKGAHCNIVCTQPRRIAAISVADRVAKERGETVGRGHAYSC